MTGRLGLESPLFKSGCRALLIALTTACPACLAAQAAPQQSKPVVRADSIGTPSAHLQAALTVEGGGTLGSYEGGLTWALVEVFRKRRALGDSVPVPGDSSRALLSRLPIIDFRAAAGASAGSINAFLAANRWCAIDAVDSAEQSVFWKAWIPTGLTELLPGRGRVGARSEKGVLSRVFLDTTFSTLDGTLRKANYNPDCSLTFGAAITRLARDSLRISPQVHARNQRYAAAFTIRGAASAGQTPLYLRPPSQSNARVRLGMLVELPLVDNGDTIRHALANDLIKASSGYPLLFEPYKVRYCPPRDTSMTEASSTRACRQNTSIESYFVDGGVFDNGPLTLAYGLALADSSTVSLQHLYMLFVTPNQRRNTGGRWDAFGEPPRGVDSASAERAREGLDALMSVLQTFIPSARQYEMQVAARLLPSIQEADNNLDSLSVRLRMANARAQGEGDRAMLEHKLRVEEWIAARRMIARLDTLRLRLDSLQRMLAQCRLVSAGCGVASQADSIILALPLPTLDTSDLAATPPTPPLASDSLLDVIANTRGHFNKLLLVTKRWHPLAGDWLFGFGGLIGRPLREYDFYVGIYDAFALMSEKMLCVDSPGPPCTDTTLARLITNPPIDLSRTGRLVLRQLYDEEFAHRDDLRRLAGSAVTQRESVLLAIVKAMGARMTDTARSIKYCEQHGPIERFQCAQGMDFVFERLRNTRKFTANIKAPPRICIHEKTDEADCTTDERFVEFVENPRAALNRLATEILYRVTTTTPDNSGLQVPLTMASAMYYATNERARRGLDRGSVSLPIGLKWRQAILFTLLPSSVGAYISIRGWYAEWAVRSHLNANIAVGATMRTVWESGFIRPSPVARGRHFVPSLRAEWKPGGGIAPWISTLGLDVSYWTDWHLDQLYGKRNEKAASLGVTSALLMEKLRVSWQTRPGKYMVRTTRKPWFVTVGFGDVSGSLYWISRAITK
jgi:predicted acylesterase/phospholipase RssA